MRWSGDRVDEFQRAADLFFGPMYETDPMSWLGDKLGIFVWSKQREILQSLIKNRYTAVQSCHNAGKSFIAGCASCWWNSVHPIGEAFVVSTAPSGPQVSAILWREIERLHRKGKLRGRITMGGQPEWKYEKELIGYGRKPSDYDEDGFQGIHALFPLIVVDEACGIPEQLWNAIDALATNDNARVLAIGNPDDPSSHFNTVCKPGSGWNVIHLDGLRTPNFTEQAVRDVIIDDKPFPSLYHYFVDKGIPFATEEIPDDLKPRLLGVTWVAERMMRWGVHRHVDEVTGEASWEESPLWTAKVRGEFPDDGGNGVIPYAWVKLANERWLAQEGTEPLGRRSYAMDVARYGEDETSIATKQGHVILSVEKTAKQDTMTSALRLKRRMATYPRSFAIVDVIGVGAGVVDRLREERVDVIAFNSAKRTDRHDVTGEFTFPNVRCASWWNLREQLDPHRVGGATICLPPNDELAADLCAPKWTPAAGAKLVVEEKEQTKKRIGRSPDLGDAVVMAFWNDNPSQWSGNPEDLAVPWGGKSEFAQQWD
jgi:hypothetical protein